MISVVIPLYNKEQSIASTLQSVLAQTYTDYEIIVVDDGSTDNSLKVVKEQRNKSQITNDRFQIITQVNYGVSAARNKGILESKEALEQKQSKLDPSSQQYKDIQAKIRNIETRKNTPLLTLLYLKKKSII